MRNSFSDSIRSVNWIRWVARGFGLVVSGLFLLIFILALMIEDRPPLLAVPTLVLLISTSISLLAAWLWERAGAIAAITGAIALGLTVLITSLLSHLGLSGFLLGLLIYTLPPLIPGLLFLRCSQSDQPIQGKLSTDQ